MLMERFHCIHWNAYSKNDSQTDVEKIGILRRDYNLSIHNDPLAHYVYRNVHQNAIWF